jgi:adenine-specific DNA-methyltransferase
MDGTSLTPEQEKLNALKQVLPEVFAEGKVDWEKLKATLGEDINFSNERYVLNWAGKSEAFKVLQTPTTKTLVPAKDEGVNFDDTEHIFIEGENLEVLKVLQKSYFGKVKMIYIDPPYNTGNDSFIYPDKFSETKSDYEKRVGDKDEDGYMTKDGMFKKNSKENGQYHSNWLNMMMPRLYLAKNLLKQNGVIFVSIDDNEVHNLRLLMNEIFGEENFVASVIWEKKFAPSNDAKWLSDNHDYVLIYSKSKIDWRPNLLSRNEKALSRYKNPDNDSRGRWVSGDMTVKTYNANYDFEITTPSGRVVSPPDGICWRFSSEKIEELISDNRVWFGKDGGNVPRLKRFLTEVKDGVTPMTIWKHKDVGHNQEAFQEVRKLFEGQQFFSTPKPIRLINQILKIGSKNDDIIIDFFSGSGTTAQAVLELNFKDGGNRKCINVQLAEKADEESDAYKAGYKTIADISKERIRRAGKKVKEEIDSEITKSKSEIKRLEGELPTEETKAEIESLKTKIEKLKNQDLGFKVLKLADSNFKQWQQITGKDKQALEEQMKLFVDPVAKNATTENMVYELLLKSGKDLNSTISHVSTGSTAEGFYAINETELILVLEKANQEIIDAVIASKPQKVIALDKLFKGNDQLKTNASLQMKDAGIEFKTI